MGASYLVRGNSDSASSGRNDGLGLLLHTATCSIWINKIQMPFMANDSEETMPCMRERERERERDRLDQKLTGMPLRSEAYVSAARYCNPGRNHTQ